MANKYGPKIVTDGLVFCIDFSDAKSYSGSGDIVYDRSGNNYDCALSNSPTFTSGYKGGLTFDGANTLCRSTLPVSQLNESFTVCVWFSNNGNGTDPSISNRLISADKSSGGTKWAIGINNSGNLTVGGNHGEDGEPTFPITNNIPYYVCFVSNGLSSYSLYINNVKELENEAYSILSTDFGNVSIGCRPNTTDRVFDGTVYKVSMYNKVFSDSEALQNFNAIKGRFGL